jgi:hypothetical protein
LLRLHVPGAAAALIQAAGVEVEVVAAEVVAAASAGEPTLHPQRCSIFRLPR